MLLTLQVVLGEDVSKMRKSKGRKRHNGDPRITKTGARPSLFCIFQNDNKGNNLKLTLDTLNCETLSVMARR
jgi:hypothetical protein